ncbi:TetR family transcriptional regulator [Catenulispora yoronensis]|uniref:TetR family transcriptional regulator n=1 Tax=Catenulispora yoronensis TaxID=450799 RepID=A0ABN2TSW5_9ACTN
MSTPDPSAPGSGPGRAPSRGEARSGMRDALVAAAVALFGERGFDATTIDDIVARAGVGRRSFFRYFPSKESVVFPDHEGTLRRMSEFLADESGFGQDPVARVCDAARMVVAMYAADPAFSLARYRLTREVPALRTHELAVVRRYESALAAFLRARYAGRADGGLRADVVSAAVVAAHNHALRSWLRSGGRGDPAEEVEHALEWVLATYSDEVAAAPRGGEAEEDVMVVVARRGTPMWRVVQRVQDALD